MKRAGSDRVIVIGGGHNGLAAAAYLAKAGRKVVVLEAADALGGLAASFELAPGYRAPGLYEDTSLVRPFALEALDIKLARKPRTAFVACGDEGEELVLEPDRADGLSGAVDAADKAAWARYRELIERLRPALLGVIDRAPLSVTDSVWTLGRAAWSVRKLGKKTMMELVRLAPMCVADLMRDLLPRESLRAALAHGALEGAFTGPWSAHTALLLIMREVMATGEAGEIVGGAPALIEALEATGRRHGVTFRTGARVSRILCDKDGVRGVRLASGEELEAHDLISTLDPKRTFLELIGPPHVPLALADAARVYRMRGITGIALLGLSRPLVTRAGTTVSALRTGASLDRIERAFDHAKYRRFATPPVLTVRVPSLGGSSSGSSLAPAGHHVAVVRATAVPYDLEGGWTEAARASCLDAIVAELERVCPGTREAITAQVLLTPVDLEARFGLSGGHLLHGEHAPDQLLSFRPSIVAGRYRTPIDGLWIGGGSSHPGGGLTAGPGVMAARALITSS